MQPVVSVIVPVYNGEQYLSKCIESIISQTFSDLEVIIVNDGSTDKSGKIADYYASKDDRIKVIHKEFGGVSSARNMGLGVAKGEYIGFVDGDDYIDRHMYETLYQLCNDYQSEIAICNLGREIDNRLLNNEKETTTVLEMNRKTALNELFKGELYRFSLCNKLFHYKCFKNIQFPYGRIHEDLSTTYKLFANATKITFINYTGYIYVKRPNSILTTRYDVQRLDAFKGWQEIINFMVLNYPQLSTQVYTCYFYNCVDHIFYILHQVEDKNHKRTYLHAIRLYMREHFKQIHKKTVLEFQYKLLFMMFKYNISLLIFVEKIRAKQRLLNTEG
ncbi:glycosyltransferase [Ornithinibacillus gellani]|uniref:glycosyltransferase n=1 Tax=Ornithinibacillus gellani TaxID=2293253 RepID=UPI00167FE9F9|nr:glycosyltransferase [Ornithinibacillus gellani]